MYERSFGEKYDKALDVVEIAKRVKSELKSKYPSVVWAVKTQRYSGGHSISVRADFGDKNPYFVVAWEKLAYGEMPVYMKPEFSAIIEGARKILDAYNYDGSEMQSDYYDVNFSGDVSISSRCDYFAQLKAQPVNEGGKFDITACAKVGYIRGEEAEELNRKLCGGMPGVSEAGVIVGVCHE